MNAEREVEFTEDKDYNQGDHGLALNRKRVSWNSAVDSKQCCYICSLYLLLSEALCPCLMV